MPRVTTTAALAARHVPETDMEAEVAALLEKAGAHSARAVAEAEEALAMKVRPRVRWLCSGVCFAACRAAPAPSVPLPALLAPLPISCSPLHPAPAP